MSVVSIHALNHWDRDFLEDARAVSRKSKDRSTKCGTVIVNDRRVPLVSGWNGFPRGVNDNVECRHDRPAKYQWTEHGERNAIYNAAAEGISLRGSTAYITGVPCCDCARALIQAGIVRVVCYAENSPGFMERWKESMAVTTEMFAEAGIELVLVSEKPIAVRTQEMRDRDYYESARRNDLFPLSPADR